jgi:hypothetical protein
MPNATVRANARTLPEAINRRAVLGAVLAAGATAALPAPVAPQPPALSDVDRQALDLWKRRADLRATATRASEQYWEAYNQLPEWAAPGPKFTRPDGSPGGTEMTSDWPMIASLSSRPVNDRRQINARPDPDDLRIELAIALKGGVDEAAILQDYSQIFAELSDRRRQQIAERERLNIDVLNQCFNAAWEDVCEIESEFENHMGGSVFALAAVLLVAIHDNCEEIDGLNRAALRMIRPQLTGAIAEDADRVLAEDEEGA